MPLSAHKMHSYLNAIDESKEKYAYDHKIQKSENKVAENDEGLPEKINKQDRTNKIEQTKNFEITS